MFFLCKKSSNSYDRPKSAKQTELADTFPTVVISPVIVSRNQDPVLFMAIIMARSPYIATICLHTLSLGGLSQSANRNFKAWIAACTPGYAGEPLYPSALRWSVDSSLHLILRSVITLSFQSWISVLTKCVATRKRNSFGSKQVRMYTQCKEDTFQRNSHFQLPVWHARFWLKSSSPSEPYHSVQGGSEPSVLQMRRPRHIRMFQGIVTGGVQEIAPGVE